MQARLFGGDQLPPRSGIAMSVLARRLDRSRCHLVRRLTSAYARTCLMWTQLPPEKGYTPPNFGPCLLWPNGWMDEDAALYGCGPRPRPHCTRRGPSSCERGTAVPPLFGSFLLWLRSPISATAELLYKWLPKSAINSHCISTR